MRARLVCRKLLAVAAAVALAGCALKPPPTTDELRRDALPHTNVPPTWKAPGGAAAPVADRWLASFDDPALSALVVEALMYNADLQAAAARVEQASGYVAVASGSIYPSVGLAATQSGKAGGGGGLNAVFLNASLELDVWGRLRYGEAAAESQSAAVQADYAYARQSLAATVAKAWFVAIEAGLQRAIVIDSLHSSESLTNLAQDRLRIGNGNEQAVAEARANVGSYRDMLRQVELAREQALRALELLLGRYPAAEIAVAQQLAPMPPAVSVGVPSELLERRPDVVAAERRVAAAFNRIGEAKAALLPRISLTAGGSNISSDVFLLQDRSNPAFSFGANLLAPIYQGGALRAQVDVRTAEQKEAVAYYARTAQRSFAEVENALAAENVLRDRDAILGANIIDNTRVLELVQIQHRVGTVDLRAVGQSQLVLYTARMSLLRVQTERRAQRVNLYLALGGGFDLPVMAPVAVQ
ncbi:MAG: TolC family protein [Betaproteobacteria bacterium]